MATLVVNASGQKVVPILLVASLTALTLSDAVDGQVVTLAFSQDSTGNWTVASTQLNGLNQPSPTALAVSYQSFRYSALNNSWAAVPTPNGVVAAYTAAGAVKIQDGIVTLAGGSAQAYTLATPVAGEQDGVTMKFVCITKQAHTITTAANIIDTVGDTLTAGASVLGEGATLQAYGGKWYLIAAIGMTLTEV